MKKQKRIIPIMPLLDYVKQEEVVWQEFGSLMEVSYAHDSERAEDSKDEYLYATLSSASECTIFDAESEEGEGFEDLIGWSHPSDLLVKVDDDILLCISSKEKDAIMMMA